jgi:hypothetical protein
MLSGTAQGHQITSLQKSSQNSFTNDNARLIQVTQKEYAKVSHLPGGP